MAEKMTPGNVLGKFFLRIHDTTSCYIHDGYSLVIALSMLKITLAMVVQAACTAGSHSVLRHYLADTQQFIGLVQ